MRKVELIEGSGRFSPNAFTVNRQLLTDCQRSARGIARASRNKCVPYFVHAPLSVAISPYRQRRSSPPWDCVFWGWLRSNRSGIAAVRKFPDNIVTACTGYSPGGPGRDRKTPRPLNYLICMPSGTLAANEDPPSYPVMTSRYISP